MKPPIICVEGDDVICFSSLEAIMQCLCEPDWEGVGRGEEVAYDSEGRRLSLYVVQAPGLFGRKTLVVEHEDTNPVHVTELARVLRSFLARTKVARDWLDTASLSDLVERGFKEARWDNSRRPGRHSDDAP